MTEAMTDRPEILTQLVALRTRAGLSQRDLAKDLGTTQSAVCEWETGAVSPTLATLARYAARFGMRLVLTVGEETAPEGADTKETT